MRQLATIAANLAWLLNSLPGALAFLVAVWFPRTAQLRILRRTLRANRDTRIGRTWRFGEMRTFADFARMPAAGYGHFRDAIAEIRNGAEQVLTAEPVKLLQPTSGTSAAPKLIPFTRGLQRQFQAALAPWIASLYVLRPGLLFGRQYWCLSPNTRPLDSADGAVPVGFADDTEYLGRSGRWLARQLLVAPPELARVAEPQAFEFLTQLFLLAADDLRLISVWHPSFLTLLMDNIPGHADALAAALHSGRLPDDLALDAETRRALQSHLRPRPDRSAALHAALADGGLRPDRLWPCLSVISCWDGPACRRWTDQLRQWFPRAAIQGKGLLATEGVVTVPWGFSGRQVCAVRSHVLEFGHAEDPEAPLLPIGDLPPSGEYTVVLTTAGGLYRYQLHDRVRASGRLGRTSCLEFVRRDGLVCDLCGEKVSEGDAAAAIHAIEIAAAAPVAFGMLVPDREAQPPRYVLILEVNSAGDPTTWPPALERALQHNFHYRHARQLGQLAPAQILRVTHGAARARAWLIGRGLRHGDVKFPALRTEDGWLAAFPEATAVDPITVGG